MLSRTSDGQRAAVGGLGVAVGLVEERHGYRPVVPGSQLLQRVAGVWPHVEADLRAARVRKGEVDVVDLHDGPVPARAKREKGRLVVAVDRRLGQPTVAGAADLKLNLEEVELAARRVGLVARLLGVDRPADGGEVGGRVVPCLAVLGIQPGNARVGQALAPGEVRPRGGRRGGLRWLAAAG